MSEKETIKLGDLIDTLTKIKADEGDLDVYIEEDAEDGGWGAVTVSAVALVHDGDGKKAVVFFYCLDDVQIRIVAKAPPSPPVPKKRARTARGRH